MYLTEQQYNELTDWLDQITKYLNGFRKVMLVVVLCLVMCTFKYVIGFK